MTTDQLTCKIARTWNSTRAAYPAASGGWVARTVARRCRVSVATVVFALDIDTLRESF